MPLCIVRVLIGDDDSYIRMFMPMFYTPYNRWYDVLCSCIVLLIRTFHVSWKHPWATFEHSIARFLAMKLPRTTPETSVTSQRLTSRLATRLHACPASVRTSLNRKKKQSPFSRSETAEGSKRNRAQVICPPCRERCGLKRSPVDHFPIAKTPGRPGKVRPARFENEPTALEIRNRIGGCCVYRRKDVGGSGGVSAGGEI